ncbi:MAG: DUF1501 domain-containing protein [Planctomycetaceae bacterium]
MRRSVRNRVVGITSIVTLLGTAAASLASEKNPAKDIDFFEKKIRPVLVAQCYECHSAEAVTRGKLKGTLTVDTRAGLLKGGDSGPAIVPGKPGESLLLKALRHDASVSAMPPKEKLSAAVIADFDWHGANFTNGRKVIPLLDQGLAALVADLHERGLDRDVSVVVWGEFGRTPKINANAGRDHWPRVTFAMLAGGGMTTGQVIGETNRLAEEPVSRPIHFQDVIATLYHNLGFDTAHTTIPDLNGRPQYVAETHEPIRELV